MRVLMRVGAIGAARIAATASLITAIDDRTRMAMERMYVLCGGCASTVEIVGDRWSQMQEWRLRILFSRPPQHLRRDR